MKIGVVQMSTQDDKRGNLAVAAAMIDDCAAGGAEFIVLPEHFNFIGTDEQKRAQAEVVGDSPSLEMLRSKAMEHRVYIHSGSLLERSGDCFYNTGVVFDPKGAIAARYRKLHLFDVEIPGGKTYLESAVITPGEQVVTFTAGGLVFGMATCYDVRFPELFRRLAVVYGVHVIVVPAAFTLQTGRDHWEILLRARAIENLCWVVAAGQWGHLPPDHLCFGRSMVVNPWGLVVAQAPDGVSCLRAEVDLETIHKTRMHFPALEHVRSDMFNV